MAGPAPLGLAREGPPPPGWWQRLAELCCGGAGPAVSMQTPAAPPSSVLCGRGPRPGGRVWTLTLNSLLAFTHLTAFISLTMIMEDMSLFTVWRRGSTTCFVMQLKEFYRIVRCHPPQHEELTVGVLCAAPTPLLTGPLCGAAGPRRRCCVALTRARHQPSAQHTAAQHSPCLTPHIPFVHHELVPNR